MNENHRIKVRYSAHLFCSVCRRETEVVVTTGSPDPLDADWERHPCGTEGCSGVLRARVYRQATPAGTELST